MKGIGISDGRRSYPFVSARIIPPRCRAIYDEAWLRTGRVGVVPRKDAGRLITEAERLAEAPSRFIKNSTEPAVFWRGFRRIVRWSH